MNICIGNCGLQKVLVFFLNRFDKTGETIQDKIKMYNKILLDILSLSFFLEVVCIHPYKVLHPSY